MVWHKTTNYPEEGLTVFKGDSMSILGQEEKIESSGIFLQKDLDVLTPNIGDSIGFYFFSTDKRSGEDGEFMICEGLMVDLKATTVEALVDTAEPVNFIPRTVLENKIIEGAFAKGNVYRIEKTLNRGDTYKGKKVKYFAWDLFKINAPTDVVTKLNSKVLGLQGKGSVLGTEQAPQPTAEKPKPKL